MSGICIRYPFNEAGNYHAYFTRRLTILPNVTQLLSRYLNTVTVKVKVKLGGKSERRTFQKRTVRKERYLSWDIKKICQEVRQGATVVLAIREANVGGSLKLRSLRPV